MVAWRLVQASRGVGGIERCLTVPSYCRERAGRDLDLSASFLYRLHQPRHCQCCHHPNSQQEIQTRAYTGCTSPPQLCWFELPSAFFPSVCTSIATDNDGWQQPNGPRSPWRTVDAVDRHTKNAPKHHHGVERLQQPHKAWHVHANGPTHSHIAGVRRRNQKVTTGRGMQRTSDHPKMITNTAKVSSTN